MARPRKDPHERRTASVRSDLTLAEKCYVQEQALRAGLSEAEYARRRMLDFQVKGAPSLRGVDVALVSEVNALGREIAAVGNLVNQVAVYCHTGRKLRPEWGELPGEVRRLGRAVESLLERLVAADGS